MTTTKERIVEATSALFMERGYSASGLKQISVASAAPIGSLYHHFPGGKAELAAATLRQSGRAYQSLVEAVLDSEDDVVDAVRSCFAGAAATLRASGYADACPIATVALEVASSDDGLRRVAHEIFSEWLGALARRFEVAGIEARPARELATTFLACLEGGFLLCRVARDAAPMDVLSEVVASQVAAAVGHAQRAGARGAGPSGSGSAQT